jgi:drug/metabolite transporter (DMT)-like permease
VLGWLFLREPVPLRTWIAIAVALVGIGLAVGGGVAGPRPGDLFALGTVLCLSGYLTVVRAAGDTDMTPCIVFGGLVAAVLAAPWATPLAVPGSSVVYLLLLGVVVIPLSLSLITMGPRYLPAHEIALVGLLEAVLGPYLVWLVLGEHPGWHAIGGGALVIAVLVAHTLIGMRADADG